MGEEKEKDTDQDSLFMPEPIVTEEDELDVDIEGGMALSTLADAEEETAQQTDLQAAIKSLMPKFKNKKLNDDLQPLMRARIFPENFLDLNYVLVMSFIEACEDEEEEIDFVGTIAAVQSATSERRGENRYSRNSRRSS